MKNNDVKTFNIIVPIDLWKFLKNRSMEEGVSMAKIINRCVEKYKKRIENKLTNNNAGV